MFPRVLLIDFFEIWWEPDETPGNVVFPLLQTGVLGAFRFDGWEINFLAGAVPWLLICVFLITFSAKRFHDRGISGWWSVGSLAMALLLPDVLTYAFVGLVYDYWWVNPTFVTVLTLVVVVGFAWSVIELGFKAGPPGVNRYGPPLIEYAASVSAAPPPQPSPEAPSTQTKNARTALRKSGTKQSYAAIASQDYLLRPDRRDTVLLCLQFGTTSQH